MRFGPSMCVPGVFSPPEEKQPLTHEIADLMMDDPEMLEYVHQLVYGLEHAWSEGQENLVWESFADNIEKLRVRSTSYLQRVLDDPDFEEHA